MLMLVALEVLSLAGEVEEVGMVSHAPIDEQSGVVQSHRWPGVFWVHNDSGDEPRLFAVNATGDVVIPPYLLDRYSSGPKAKAGKPEWPGLMLEGASNIDWEDIAVDENYLYVAETGNNGNARRDLGVYVLPEPNPHAQKRVRPLTYWPVAYPQQENFPGKEWHWDCEALFSFQGKLYFITKHRVAGKMGQPENTANLYRLDTQHTDQINVLTHVDHHQDLGGWVTGADVSPDGSKLAVLVNAPAAFVWVFDAPEVGDRFLSQPGRSVDIGIKKVKQAEGITWINNTQLMITNEQRQMFTLAAP